MACLPRDVPAARCLQERQVMRWPILRPSTIILALDTSVLIGLLDARDVWHAQATRLHDALLAARVSLVFFDCVLAEASSTLARRLREQRQVQELADLLDRLEADFPHRTIET